jgi:hypothetical protein
VCLAAAALPRSCGVLHSKSKQRQLNRETSTAGAPQSAAVLARLPPIGWPTCSSSVTGA